MEAELSGNVGGLARGTRVGLPSPRGGGRENNLACACICACARFLVWLKMGELELGEGGEDGSGYYVMG